MAFQKKQWQFNDIITEGELNRMEDGIEEGIVKAEDAKTSIEAHVNNKNNPHNVTPEQIGAETPVGAQAKAEAAAGAVRAELDAHKNEIATQTEYGHIRLSDIPTSAGIPRGVIVMWSGSVDEIPEGWALCDGTNGTPDLRDRFIVGAGNEYDVGDTGGAKEVTLSASQIPSHRHGSGSLSTGSAGSHSHNGSTSSAGSHSHSGSTSSAGSHSHTYREPEIVTSDWYDALERGSGKDLAFYNRSTGSSGSHTHSLSISSAGSHSHDVTIESAGSHSHSVTGYTDYTGSGQAHENRPPYYALAFIMKL